MDNDQIIAVVITILAGFLSTIIFEWYQRRLAAERVAKLVFGELRNMQKHYESGARRLESFGAEVPSVNTKFLRYPEIAFEIEDVTKVNFSVQSVRDLMKVRLEAIKANVMIDYIFDNFGKGGIIEGEESKEYLKNLQKRMMRTARICEDLSKQLESELPFFRDKLRLEEVNEKG